MSDMKKVSVATPIGEAKWFSVNKADKFGNYTVELHLDESPESMQFINSLENFSPIKDNVKLPFEKTPEGYKVKLKSKSQGQKRTGETYTINAPAIYNSFGHRLQGADLERLNVGNGSKIRANIEVKQYNFAGQDGVSIGLKSVQIAELVEYSGNGDVGFGALEVEQANVETEEQENLSSEQTSQYDF